MNKNNKIIFVAAIFIVGILIVSSAPNFNIMTLSEVNTTVVPSTIQGYTGTYNFPSGAQSVHDKIRGKDILKGNAIELFDDAEYVTSWYNNGDSEKIVLCTGNQAHVETWNAGHDFIGSPRRPSVLVGRYWYEGWFTSNTGTTTKIFGKNYINSAYVKIDGAGSFEKQKFGNVKYKTDYSQYSLGGETEWWFPDPQPLDYSKTTSLVPGAITFRVTGQRVGTIKLQLVVEYSELCVWGLLGSTFGYSYNYKVMQEDQAILKSGLGDVDVTSKNSLSGIPGYDAEGTGDDYTKYVYNEGQTVSFHIKTGVSGQTTGNNVAEKRWKFDILKDGTTSVYTTPQLLNDNWEGDISWTIPLGTGNAEFKVKLYNGLLQQSESKIYSVKEISKIPGRTTIATPTSGTTVYIGDSVTVRFSASPNPVTLSPIARFDGWAKYYSKTSSSYAFSSSQITATNGQGQFTFTPDRVGNVYIQVIAVDTSGYFGAENADCFVTVTNRPTYVVTVTVADSDGAAINDATVVFGSKSQNTVNGLTQFTVENGDYALTVSKTGYNVYSGGIITVTSTSTKTIPVILSLTGTTPTPPPSDDGTPQPGVEYTLTVTVQSTGGFITGATVEASGISDTTDANGVATIIIPSGEQTLTVSASGYNLYTELITVTADTPKTVTLTSITPVTPGTDATIIVTVITTNSVKVEGVNVTIGTVTGKTDSTGIVNLVVPSTTSGVTITAKKTGYTEYTGTIYPSGNMEFTVALKKTSTGIPGFEMIFAILAIGIVMIGLRYRKKNE